VSLEAIICLPFRVPVRFFTRGLDGPRVEPQPFKDERLFRRRREAMLLKQSAPLPSGDTFI